MYVSDNAKKVFCLFFKGGEHTRTHKMNTDNKHTVAGIVNAIRQESLKCQGKERADDYLLDEEGWLFTQERRQLCKNRIGI